MKYLLTLLLFISMGATAQPIGKAIRFFKKVARDTPVTVTAYDSSIRIKMDSLHKNMDSIAAANLNPGIMSRTEVNLSFGRRYTKTQIDNILQDRREHNDSAYAPKANYLVAVPATYGTTAYNDGRYKPIDYTAIQDTSQLHNQIVALVGAVGSKQPLGSYLTTETDPIWSGVAAGYRTKVQNDGLYAAISHTHSIGQVVGLSDSLSAAYGRYLSNANAFGNVYTKTQSDGRYLQSYSETDPNVSAYSKSLTGFSVIKASTDPLYKPIGYTPAISDVTSLQTALDGKQASGNYLTSSYTPPYQVKVWNKSAQLSSAGILITDTFSIASASPTITLPLPTGTTIAKVLSVTGYRVSATAANSPQVSISAFTNTSVSLVLTQANSTTISLLGVNVIGLQTVPDPAYVKVLISYIAY